jgi:hypothetical protein
MSSRLGLRAPGWWSVDLRVTPWVWILTVPQARFKCAIERGPKLCYKIRVKTVKQIADAAPSRPVERTSGTDNVPEPTPPT